MTLPNTAFLIGSVFFLLFPQKLFAADHLTVALEITCPQEIRLNEAFDAIPPGWTGNNSKTRYGLAGATFSNSKDVGRLQDGQDDNDISELMPDQEITVDTHGTVKHLCLFPDRSATYTLRCFYDRTRLELSQALPENIRACELTQLEGHGVARLNKVRCFR